MPIPLRTARLILRFLVLADAPALFAYRANPAVSVMQGWTPASREEAATFVAAVADIPFARPTAWSQLGIVRVRSDDLVGDVGVLVDARGDAAEIGYTIAPAFQQRGYATEAVRAVLAELEAVHGIQRFSARTDPRNAASIALLRRLGFTEEECIGDDLRFRR